MLVRGELVVKLPRDRAEALVAEGDATPFDPGHGRIMRDWVSVSSAREPDWTDLVAEAFAYISSTIRR